MPSSSELSEEFSEPEIVPTKDLKVVTDDITIDMGEVKPEKTYEDFLIEKERQKEERKKKIQAELADEKLIETAKEEEWNQVDETTKENADEKDNDSDSDSSGDND